MKIPNLPIINILAIPDTPLKRATWKNIPIASIEDDIVVFKNGGAAIIMEATSLNFSLLSEKEQEAVIAAYAALLNSLSFPIQIFIRSQKKDISTYIKHLDESTAKMKNPKLARLIQNYKSFIENSVKKKNVLGKKFYILIPFSPLELGVSKSIGASLKRGGTLPFSKAYIVKKAKIILYPKRNHLLRQVSRFGIKLTQLNKEQLINLYYNIFNVEAPTITTKKENKNA